MDGDRIEIVASVSNFVEENVCVWGLCCDCNSFISSGMVATRRDLCIGSYLSARFDIVAFVFILFWISIWGNQFAAD